MTQTDHGRSTSNTPHEDDAATGLTPAVSSNADLRVKGDQANDAPENFNSEQDDEAAQAQTVSDDAIRGSADRAAAYESEHGGSTNPAQIDPDDAQDVVDHMNQMERSGRIDMDAYRGERSDDDEPETYGEAALEPGDVDSHGNRVGNTD